MRLQREDDLLLGAAATALVAAAAAAAIEGDVVAAVVAVVVAAEKGLCDVPAVVDAVADTAAVAVFDVFILSCVELDGFALTEEVSGPS